MNGLTQAQVAEIYAHMATLDTHHAHLVLRDTEPVALLQTYDPAADRVGDCYDVRPGDIGIHLLLAPAGPDGGLPGWSSALLGALASYVLLGLDRRRVVVDRTCGTRRRSRGSCGRGSCRGRGSSSRRWTYRTSSCPKSTLNWPFSPARWPSRSLPE